MTDLVIVGAGGFGRELLQVVKDVNDETPRYNVLGFLDSSVPAETEIHDLAVLGDLEWLEGRSDVATILAIGSPATRLSCLASLRAMHHERFETVVHPRAWIGRNVKLGAGTVVTAGCAVTTDICIGDHVVLNLGSTIGHDAVVGDLVTLSPSVNVSGGCRVEEGCDIGTGCQILPSVSIGAWSVVGAGAVVTRDLETNVTAVGMPARVTKRHSHGWQHGRSRQPIPAGEG